MSICQKKKKQQHIDTVELVAIVKTFQQFIVPLPDSVIFAEIAILLLIFYVAISFISLETFFLLLFP